VPQAVPIQAIQEKKSRQRARFKGLERERFFVYLHITAQLARTENHFQTPANSARTQFK
jgi:hypothetical protein